MTRKSQQFKKIIRKLTWPDGTMLLVHKGDSKYSRWYVRGDSGKYLSGGMSSEEYGADRADTQRIAVAYFAGWLRNNNGAGLTRPKLKAMEALRERILSKLPDLAGHDLCCWCAPELPCHADVLLEIANEKLRA